MSCHFLVMSVLTTRKRTVRDQDMMCVAHRDGAPLRPTARKRGSFLIFSPRGSKTLVSTPKAQCVQRTKTLLSTTRTKNFSADLTVYFPNASGDETKFSSHCLTRRRCPLHRRPSLTHPIERDSFVQLSHSNRESNAATITMITQAKKGSPPPL